MHSKSFYLQIVFSPCQFCCKLVDLHEFNVRLWILCSFWCYADTKPLRSSNSSKIMVGELSLDDSLIVSDFETQNLDHSFRKNRYSCEMLIVTNYGSLHLQCALNIHQLQKLCIFLWLRIQKLPIIFIVFFIIFSLLQFRPQLTSLSIPEYMCLRWSHVSLRREGVPQSLENTTPWTVVLATRHSNGHHAQWQRQRIREGGARSGCAAESQLERILGLPGLIC